MERSNNIELKNNFYDRSRTSLWSFEDYDHQQDLEYLQGFSWPPRSYTCRFCKREFRSAQAVGGHMNVHRRDRAKLKLQHSLSSSSTLSPPNPNPNPNPNPPPHPPLTLFPTLAPPSLSPKSKHSPENACELTQSSIVVEDGETKRLNKKDACKFLKNGEIISLELEIGLINESEQDLDLELRLGLAN